MASLIQSAIRRSRSASSQVHNYTGNAFDRVFRADPGGPHGHSGWQQQIPNRASA